MAMKMKSSMKAMKAMKAMSSMKMRKAMKVSKIAKGKLAKAAVFRGSKVKTVGGLKKTDLKKSKTGKIVSVKASLAGKKAFKRIAGWTTACAKARKALGIKGFAVIGGKTPAGQKLYAKAKSFYKK